MQTLTAEKNPLARRITSIDLLRGSIMIIMALDHVRDYFNADALKFDPLDLSKTNGALFFTRWITHFCAPLFMFLSGTSAFFVSQRKTKKELSSWLIKRGLWLVILEFTVVRFGWYFNLFSPDIDFIVIWALGISMISLGLLVHFPKKFILGFGLLLVLGHNLLDGINVPGQGTAAFLWALLHQVNLFPVGRWQVLVLYPIIPWIGVMALGFCLGSLYSSSFPADRRRKILLWLGLSMIFLFIIVRAVNVYGDPSPRDSGSSAFFSFLSFLRVTKYPPSLDYLLMTLGPGILFLALSERIRGSLSEKIMVYGRVPMFYYLCHIYLMHLLALIATQCCGHRWTDMILNTFPNGEPHLKGYGFSLGVTYLVWMLVVLSLYPLCKRYDRYKMANKQKWWLSYL